MPERVHHHTELIQLDANGLHWLHTCHECTWQRLICEHQDGDLNPVEDAQAHPVQDPPRRTRLVLITDNPADRATDTVTR